MSEDKKEGEEKKRGGINALLTGNKQVPEARGNVPKKTKEKGLSKAKPFTLTIQPETIELFNQIQWLREYAIDFKRATRDDVLSAALKSYAKEIGFDALMAKHKNKVPDTITPKHGRPAKN